MSWEEKARSYSERPFRGEEIDSLAPAQALEAFTRPLEQTARGADPALATGVVEEVEGYPYFLLASARCPYTRSVYPNGRRATSARCRSICDA